MNRTIIVAGLLAVSLAGCATDGYNGGYVEQPYYDQPDYIAPGPAVYYGGGGYYRPGYPGYRPGYPGYRPGYPGNRPHPGNWPGHGTKPWNGPGPRPIPQGGQPGFQHQQNYHNQPNYQQGNPGQRPRRPRYE